MTQQLTSPLIAGLLVLTFVSGYYIASVIRRPQTVTFCDPSLTKSWIEERILRDNSLQYRPLSGVDWMPRAPTQPRPLATMTKK